MAEEFAEAQRACFEAGIKFGSLYHQFAGAPVSPGSADSLASAIEESIENQPHCEEVAVDVRTDRLAADLEESGQSYAEFTGKYAEATIAVRVENTEVVARMAMEDGYPLMRLVSVE